jgi:hypothetical protein
MMKKKILGKIDLRRLKKDKRNKEIEEFLNKA